MFSIEDHLDAIRLLNLVFYSYHGVEKSEKEKGQRFEIDIELFLDLKKAGQTDRLEETIDYSRVYQIVEEIVIEDEYTIIEALAESIAQTLLSHLNIQEILVRVRKPHVSIHGILDSVEVEIVRP